MFCKKCRFWQLYEGNGNHTGMCSGIGVMKAGFITGDPASVAITFAQPDSLAQNPPISDYIVRTDAEFSCINWRSKEDQVKKTING